MHGVGATPAGHGAPHHPAGHAHNRGGKGEGLDGGVEDAWNSVDSTLRSVRQSERGLNIEEWDTERAWIRH